MSRKAIAIVFACLAVLAVVLAVMPRFWMGGSDGISGHGWAAYIIGAVMTVGLSGGLFFLTFYSARHGP
jgi:ABC-type antimicrobial peptide transport system permease subunit